MFIDSNDVTEEKQPASDVSVLHNEVAVHEVIENRNQNSGHSHVSGGIAKLFRAAVFVFSRKLFL